MAESIYEVAGGDDTFLQLAHAWHARCVEDPVVSHAFSHGFHAEHTQRLAAYWAQALGGPQRYSNSMSNESDVVRMHSGNGEHLEMDERAIDCFAQALDDVGLTRDARLASSLMAYFRWSTQTMASYPHSKDDVPSGLAFAYWSWDGQVASD